MPLGSAPKSTIDIDFTRAQGVNSTGRITFQPPRIRVGDTMLSTRSVSTTVVDGIGSVSIARIPTGTYHVTEYIDNQEPYEWDFALPLDAAETIQYETIAEVSPVPAIYTVVRTVNGVAPDPVTGNVEVEGGGGGGIPSTRRVDTTAPLTGGGDLSANRTIALNSGAITSLAKAETALQPGQAATPVHTHSTSQITDFTTAVNALVSAAIAVVIDSAPGALDTLNELAAALGDDPNFAATITTALAGKPATADVILKTFVDAKGDLIVGSADNTPVRLAVGANGQILYADSTQPLGVRWGAPPAGGGGSSFDSSALRYGCKAITMHPHDLSPVTPQYIEMTVGRLYQYWVPLASGTELTKVRLPVQLQGTGGGSVEFGVYQDDNTLLGRTGDVGALLQDPSVAEDWVDLNLLDPASSTGPGVWIVGLATGALGPKVAFSNTSGSAELPPWLLNPVSHPTALRTEGASDLPVTLNPGVGIPYIDFCVGVA